MIPREVPAGFALFYTTTDVEGHLRDGFTARLLDLVRERFGIEATLATCNQVHGANVVKAPAASGDCDSCDALWSDQPHIALGIKVADCLPVTIIDAAHGVIANVHSGWRGAVQQITRATLDTIARDGAFTATTSRAWLGPAIRVCCFEVGEEVVEQFRASYEDADAFIARARGAKPHIDVAGLTRAMLEQRGVDVIDLGICTKCDALFHSFRREPKRGGRNLALVAR